MVEAINHDTASTIATAGKSAVKWGVAGVIGAGVIGAGVGAAAMVAGGALFGAVTGLGLVGLAAFAGIAAVTTAASFIGTGPVAPIIGGAVATVAVGIGGLMFAPAALATGAGIGAAYMVGPGLVFTGIGAAAAGLLSASTYGTTGALLGGLFGLLKGSSQASAESAAYQQKLEATQHVRGNKIAKAVNDAEIRGMQQGYMMGAQEAEQRIVAQLQNAAQEEMLRQQMGGAAGKAPQMTMAGAIAAEGMEKKVATTVDQNCETKCKTHVQKVEEQRAARAAGVGAAQIG